MDSRTEKMAFRPTEFTIREVLLNELESRGVHIGHELSTSVPTGRMAPDAILRNGADYVLETKLGGQSDLFEDIKKLAEWIKLKEVPIKGAFAVLFPGELRNLPWDQAQEAALSPKTRYEVTALFRDKRPGNRSTGSIKQVAKWISDYVLQAPLQIQHDTDFVVKVLAGAVGQLTYQIRDLDVQELEDIFGGRTVFDNILEIDDNQRHQRDLINAASYLVINQLIFYHVLSNSDPDRYRSIDADSMRSPAELTDYFRKVLEVDYAPTFGFDIASRLPEKSTDTLKSIIEVIQAMGMARLNQDILGKVFHNLIPLSIRKPVAAYYTNSNAADFLARISVRTPADSVFDPACGSGTLLVACYQRKKELLEGTKGSFSEIDHKRFTGADITGSDIMPFAAHLAVVHLSLQAPEFVTQKVRIAVEDSTRLKPDTDIPSITRELRLAFRRPTLDMFDGNKRPRKDTKFVERGVLTPDGLGGEGIHLSKVDVVIMNPPFTRSERLGSEYKETLKRRFGADGEDLLKGKISFQGHFLLLADRFLAPGGRIAAVLPQATFTGDAYKRIIGKLLEEYEITTFVVGLGRTAFSENTALSEVLIVAEKTTPDKDHMIALIGAKISPSEWVKQNIESMAKAIERGENTSTDDFTLIFVPQKNLDIERGGLTRIIPLLQPGHRTVETSLRELMHGRMMIPYLELEKKGEIEAFASVLNNREVAGDNGRGNVYFGTSALNIIRNQDRPMRNTERMVLEKVSDKNLVVKDRGTGAVFNVPVRVIVPSVRTMSYCHKMDASHDSELIIGSHFDGLNKILTALYGSREAGTYERRIKQKWASRTEKGSARLHLVRKVNLSAVGTIHMSVFTNDPSFLAHPGWGIRCSPDDAKMLCLWFNSTLFLFQLLSERTQIEGAYWRLDKSRYARTMVPDIRRMTSSQSGRFIALFNEVKDIEFPTLMDQLNEPFGPRRRIDTEWLALLGISRSDAESLLNDLYSYMYETVKDLRESMRG